MIDAKEVEKLLFEIMKTGRRIITKPVDLSVEHIAELTWKVTALKM